MVALLSGRNFETKQYEDAIAEESFGKLKKGIQAFINKTHFDRFTMILRSAGFITNELIYGRNAVNFAYILYLKGRSQGIPADDIERLVRRWYAMSVLTGRYTGSPETAFDLDIRQIESRGLQPYVNSVLENELPETFWTGMLPQLMDTSSALSPYFLCYKAAQAKLGDKGFLSRDITVRDLLLNRCDVHHFYPRNLLKKQGLTRGRYNQIANYVIAQSEINIAIGDKPPQAIAEALQSQCSGGAKKYGGITDLAELQANCSVNCIPDAFLAGQDLNYDEFLEQRRKLMALRIKSWITTL